MDSPAKRVKEALITGFSGEEGHITATGFIAVHHHDLLFHVRREDTSLTDGMPHNSTICISNVGVMQNKEWREAFAIGLTETELGFPILKPVDVKPQASEIQQFSIWICFNPRDKEDETFQRGGNLCRDCFIRCPKFKIWRKFFPLCGSA